MNEALLYEVHCHVARITLNRPETGNLVNDESLTLLHEMVSRADADPDIRAIVIEGKDKVFSRGMDFGFMLKRSDNEGIADDFGEPYARAVLKIRNATKPVIAAVDGDITAGGTGIALACDIVIATERTSFGLSEVLFGIIPAYVFPLLLERVSLKRARYLVLSSERLKAKDAKRFGIFDEIAEDDELEKTVSSVLKRLLFASPDALAAVKKYSDDIFGKKMEDAMAAAGRQLSTLLRDPKSIEAINAFLDGEKPSFSISYKKRR